MIMKPKIDPAAMQAVARCSACVLGLWTCGPATAGPPASEGNRASTARLYFRDATAASGIDFKMTCGGTPSRHILEVDGGGVALFDADNDGDLDLFFANGATLEDPEHGPGSRLYLNRGGGKFQDVTGAAGIQVRRWAMGVAVGDINADGRDDLFIACYGPNIMLRNEGVTGGVPRFRDVTAEAGVGDDRWATSAAFGDIDRDGDLDLFVANYLEFDVKHPPDRANKRFKGVPVMAGPAGLKHQADILYENQGGGVFRDVTAASGCAEAKPGYGLGVRMMDFNDDGHLDIFVGNDSNENFLYRGRGGGRFEEVAVIAGVASNGSGDNQATMGITLGDVDDNGRVDLFSTNFSSDTNTLHLNLDGELFDDRTDQYALGMISRPFLSWGCGLYDFELDGDEDLFIASGHVYPEAATHNIDSEYEQRLLLFERRGPLFALPETPAGEIFEQRYSGRSTAFGDIDGDGDVDVVMTTLNGPVHVFRNDSTRAGAPLVVELAGPPGNPRGFGSKVEWITPHGTQRRWITGGGSYQSVDAAQAYFGLPAAPTKTGLAPEAARAHSSTLQVTWPDRTVSVIKDPPAGHRLKVGRPPAELAKVPLLPQAAP